MKKITKEKAIKIGKTLKVNFEAVPLETLIQGINVEMEHGKHDIRTNIIDDSFEMAAKIALAHLVEFPDYYKRLEKLEDKAKKYWKSKKKPNIFL